MDTWTWVLVKCPIHTHICRRTFTSFKWRAHSCLRLMTWDISQTLRPGAKELVNRGISVAGRSGPRLFLDTGTVIFGVTVCVGVWGYKYTPPRRPPVFARACMPIKADRSLWESHNQTNVLKDRYELVRVCVRAKKKKLSQYEREKLFITIYCIVYSRGRVLTFLLPQQET